MKALIMIQSRNAFTLLELLLVMAVIGILTSIAVPNYMDAQTKTKIARAQSDQRVLAMGIETMRLDQSRVPTTNGPFVPSYFERLQPLTTPIAYLNELPTDPFQPMVSPYLFAEEEASLWQNQMYVYNRNDAENGTSNGGNNGYYGYGWSLTSVGPDHRLHYPYYYFPSGFVMPEWYEYDPSNGLISGGEIFYRSQNSLMH